MNTQFVRNWMTSNPITITLQTTLPEAQRLMLEYGIRRLPVVHKGKLVGIVTFGDIRESRPSESTALSVYEMNYLMNQANAKEIMTPDAVVISPDASIAEAARLILEHKIGGLPVIQDGTVVGIITESDLCRVLMAQAGRPPDE